MHVAVYRYVPTQVYQEHAGSMWEKQKLELVTVIQAKNEIEACKAFPPQPYTCTFIRVEDGDA